MFIVVPFTSSTRLAIVAEAELLCGIFLSEKSCRHKLIVSTSFWSWLLNVSSVLTSLKYIALLLWFVNALWVCWQFMGVLRFWFWSFCFWKMSFFVFILDAIFCGTNFFIFQDSVWLVKKSWSVRCWSNPQFYSFSDPSRTGFALWRFFVQKSCRHKLVVSTSFWSWLLNASSVLTSLKHAALLFLFVFALWVCWMFMGLLRFGFWSLWFWKMSFFCVCSWCDLLWYKIFHISGHCVAS